MQTRISRPAPRATPKVTRTESQEFVGRISDAVNPEEEMLLVESDCVASRSTPSVESVLHPDFIPNQAEIEALLGRQIIRAMSSPADLETVLPEIAAILGKAYGVEGCLISVQASSQTMPAPIVWFTESLSAAQETEILANYPVLEAETLATAGCLLLISDAVVSEIAHAWKALSIRSIMCVPVQFQNQTNGVICLLRSHPHQWTEPEITTLTHLCDQVGVAISQVLLQRRVAKQSEYQALLRQVAMAIQHSGDVPQIQQLAIDGIAQALDAERAFLLRIKFWDPRQSLRSFEGVPKARMILDCEWRREQLAESQETTQLMTNQSFWVSECVLCQAAIAESEKSLTFSDASEFPHQTETTDIASIFDLAHMSALMLVPLESKNRLLGFIAIQQRNPRTWQQAEIELVELISAQISSAIIQTETLRQVESLVEERTAQLQQSLELQAKLYEMTRKQIEKLREMNQRMDEFLSTLSHELRTPLTSMMLAIRMLRQGNLSPDRRIQYLNILEQQCAQETSLINDLLALQELETKQVAFQLQRVDLRQLLSDLAQSFEQRWSAKGLQLSIEMPDRALIFNTDLASLNRILLELLTNAGKYAEPNSTVQLKVTPQPTQQIQVGLCNVGSGISEAELPHIFDKFRRCQGMTQNAVPGTGLGLALVKSLVQHLNGSIKATSAEIEGLQSYETCFIVTLPQNLEILDG